jgi:hypothetical protein
MNLHKSSVAKKYLMQQRKNFTQQFFIVAANMLICNHVNVRGGKNTTNAMNNFMVATCTHAIGTNITIYTTFFHCGHSHAYSQPTNCLWQQRHIKCNE